MISAQSSDPDYQNDPLNPENYVERLFLPNSRDFVRLLVNFNMSTFHP